MPMNIVIQEQRKLLGLTQEQVLIISVFLLPLSANGRKVSQALILAFFLH